MTVPENFSCQIVLDSVNESGDRLTTALLTFPRVVLSEFNTHRVFSRNSASSRAIPVSKMIRQVLRSPYIPPRIGVNQAGMQAREYLKPGSAKHTEYMVNYMRKRDLTLLSALGELVGTKATQPLFDSYFKKKVFPESEYDELLTNYSNRLLRKQMAPTDLNIHKQHVNRSLEEFAWHTVIVTANTFDNFFALRNHEDADPAIETIARIFQEEYEQSTPTLLRTGEWHLPLIQPDEREEAFANPMKWRDVSTGRCARTSYLTHTGKRDIDLDIRLAIERLVPPGHMSPFEHPAEAAPGAVSGNFVGFKQYRKEFPYEDDFSKVLKQRATA